MTPTETTAIIGAVTGPLGLLLSILSYTRDRARLWISMTPDMKTQNAPQYDPAKKYLVVTVSNTGRRPEYVDMVALLQPDGASGIINDMFFNPNEVHEGRAPAKYLVDQSSISEFASQWAGISALVRTSSGRQYRSKYLQKPPKGCIPASWFERFLLRTKTRLKHRWAFQRRFLA
jgi:hypothetical protein